MKKKFLIVGLAFLALVISSFFGFSSIASASELIIASEGDYDVVVYGATSAGITAAIGAKREGANVVLISNSNHVGGLTTSGLGATDMANRNVVGGITYDFYHRIYEYYLDEENWTSQTRDDYFENFSAIYGGKDDNLEMQWVFEPHVAEQIFTEMLIDDGVPIIFDERIDLENGVVKENGYITKIILESGKEFSAKTFIDASYEGDLMAKAGVNYTIGREANSQYNETMNGILPNSNERDLVSPFIVESDPESGLLPYIEDKALGVAGEEDSRVQAYCFRFTLTSDPNNMIPITKPENYHPEWYEVRGRKFLTNPKTENELTFNLMPNLKTDMNHADFVGMSYEYADGDYLSRNDIKQSHKDYVLGILYFYAYDERVPMSIRLNMRKYGLAKDEFLDSDYFPTEIYLREGRRMVSDYVMKESDVIQNSTPGVIEKTTAPHSIGQGFYWFDSHRVAYFSISNNVADGIETDGNFWNSRRDYPISYESVVPNKEDCKNIFVPVCLSSTHAAYGSIRMETTYMIVAESCGTAAAMCANELKNDANFAVQDLNYASLAVKLAYNGQKLGDIIAEDLTSGELAVLRLQVVGLITTHEADLLISSFASNEINNQEAILAIKNIFINSAKRINKKVSSGKELDTLVKASILSNADQWNSLFAETLPSSLSIQNTSAVLDKIAKFFSTANSTGYLYDWLGYLLDNHAITNEQFEYFSEYAWGGKLPSGSKTHDVLVQIAKALDPQADTALEQLKVFTGISVIGNQAVWQGIFENTQETANGSNLNGLFKNLYNYMSTHEDAWKNRIPIAYYQFFLNNNLIDSEYEIELLANSVSDKLIRKEAVTSLLINSANYIEETNDITKAINILEGLDVDLSNIKPLEADIDGLKVQELVIDLYETLSVIERTIPLDANLMNKLIELNIVDSATAQHLIENARDGRNVDKDKLALIINFVGGRLDESLLAIDALVSRNIISAEIKDELEGDFVSVDGALANQVIRSLAEYITDNNLSISDTNLNLLVNKNIIPDTDKIKFKNALSLFANISAFDASNLFINMSKIFDASITDSIDAIALLANMSFIADKVGLEDALETGFVSGVLVRNIVEGYLEYLNNSYQDYLYLKENEIISNDLFTYFVNLGKSTSVVDSSKIIELITKMCKVIDSSVETAEEMVNILANRKAISQTTTWVNVLNSSATINNDNVLTVVSRMVLAIKALDAIELPDTVLDYFAQEGFIKDATTYNKAYFKANAKIGGGTLNQGETQNMLIRAFRKVSGAASSTGQNLVDAVMKSGFTFSDDPAKEAELGDYWYTRIKAKNPVDGEMLRELMMRIYEFLNK